MVVWAIVPVKHLSEAKSSLAPALVPEQRRELVLCMLGDVLGVLRETLPGEVVVVSSDDEVLKFAGEYGATCLKEQGVGLNEALRLAIRYAVTRGATSVLIVPADVPMVKESDIEKILGMTSTARDIVIAPSNTNGTNALSLRPPDVIEPRFGGESFPLHIAESLRAGIEPKVFRSPTIALDVDEPADLLKVEVLGLGTRTHEFLRSLHN